MDKSKFKIKKEWQKFGISIAVILSLIATIQLIIDKDLYPYFYGGAAFFLFFGLLLPIIIKPIYILFSYIGFVLGWFMTRIILSILFYMVFTPLGVVSRIFGKNFLDIKLTKAVKSYWIDYKMDKDVRNYETQF